MIRLTIVTILLFFCLDPTLQIVINLFSSNFYYFLIPFQCRLDDRNAGLVIDSAVAYHKNDGIKVMLFSADQLYESESVNMNDDRLNFTVKSIQALDESLEPPIDTAYYTISHGRVNLHLINVS